MDDRQLYETIEAYLLKQMSAAETAAFESAMRADPALAQRTELYRHSLRAAERLAEKSLHEKFARWRQEVETTGTPSKPGHSPRLKIWPFLGALLLALAGSIVLWKHNNNTPGDAVKPRENSAKPDTAYTAPTIKKPIAIQPDTPPGAPEGNRRRLLAKADPADFAANFTMDKYINSLRSNNNTVRITAPPYADTIMPNARGRSLLHFAGTIAGLSDKGIADLELLIFNNQNDQTPLLILSIQATANTAGVADFDLRHTADFPQGRYYYIVQTKKTEQVLQAGMFLIGKL